MRPILHVTLACILALVLRVDISQGSIFDAEKEKYWVKRDVSSSSSLPTPVAVPSSLPPSPTTFVPTAAPSSSLAPSGSGSGNATAPATPAPVSTSVNPGNYTGLPVSASFSTGFPATVTWLTPTLAPSNIPLYKIGSNVTLSWGYNSLSVAPINVTIAAVAASQTWTISVIQGIASSAVWNLAAASASQALIVASYSILINDQRGPKAWPSPGWLYPDHQLTIGIYTTQPYVPVTDTVSCATCTVAGSDSFRALREAVLPLATTMSVAVITAGMFLWGMFY